MCRSRTSNALCRSTITAISITDSPTCSELITFDIGADLFVRDRASPSAVERNITESITQDLGDVRDLEASFDGTKILFAMRAQFIEGADEEDQPKWNIWEYDLVNDVPEAHYRV